MVGGGGGVFLKFGRSETWARRRKRKVVWRGLGRFKGVWSLGARGVLVVRGVWMF